MSNNTHSIMRELEAGDTVYAVELEDGYFAGFEKGTDAILTCEEMKDAHLYSEMLDADGQCSLFNCSIKNIPAKLCSFKLQ